MKRAGVGRLLVEERKAPEWRETRHVRRDRSNVIPVDTKPGPKVGASTRDGSPGGVKSGKKCVVGLSSEI